MITKAISARQPEVAIEFDTANGRATKHFEDANAAKRFFIGQEKAGKNPKVLGVGPALAAETPPESPAKPRTAPKAKPPADTPVPASKAEKPAGVTPAMKTVPHLCGVVIAEYGLEAGVTQEMVDRVAELSGRVNPKQDWFNLRNTWHGIRGYLESSIRK